MNKCIVELLTDDAKVARFVEGLPVAFEMAANEIPKGNAAIGMLREHILLGYFISEFGNNQVEIPERGNRRGFDAIICGDELSIKTLTGLGHVKILWTVDQERVRHEVYGGGYYPHVDIFFVSVNWEKICKSVFYIPVSVQSEIYEGIGTDRYFYVPTGTNHRGIAIRGSTMKKLIEHSDTIKCSVDWVRQGLNYTPYERWEEFWKNR